MRKVFLAAEMGLLIAFLTALTHWKNAPRIDPRATVFVSSSGDDRKGDGSMDRPYRTLDSLFFVTAPYTYVYLSKLGSDDYCILKVVARSRK